MTERLNRIVTRGGDSGTTGLADGSRVAKDHPLIEAIGDIDELNCLLGMLLTMRLPEAIDRVIGDCQHRLFDLGGELAMGEVSLLADEQLVHLEGVLDELNAGLPALTEFILPGGNEGAARAHLARAVCRRAERRLVSLHHSRAVNPVSLKFLNRLSDLLFVVARILVRSEGPESLWQNTHNKPDGLQSG